MSARARKSRPLPVRDHQKTQKERAADYAANPWNPPADPVAAAEYMVELDKRAVEYMEQAGRHRDARRARARLARSEAHLRKVRQTRQS